MNLEEVKRMFAEIVAYEYGDLHEDLSWRLAAGIGDTEDRWENFCYWFKEVFGISWEEAENPKG